MQKTNIWICAHATPLPQITEQGTPLLGRLVIYPAETTKTIQIKYW